MTLKRSLAEHPQCDGGRYGLNAERVLSARSGQSPSDADSGHSGGTVCSPPCCHMDRIILLWGTTSPWRTNDSRWVRPLRAKRAHRNWQTYLSCSSSIAPSTKTHTSSMMPPLWSRRLISSLRLRLALCATYFASLGEQVANLAVERTCAKSRAGCLLPPTHVSGI
jgi:hypothetical protein